MYIVFIEVIPISAMSKATYEMMWREAMGDLKEQLNTEGFHDTVDLSKLQGDGQKVVSHAAYVAKTPLDCFHDSIVNRLLKLKCPYVLRNNRRLLN